MQQLFVADEESWLGITKEGLLNCSKEYVCPDECRDWSELMAVAVLDEIWYGLQSDGTILEYYPNIGNAQLEDFINIRWAKVLTSADMTVTQGVIAQTLDGKILYYGTNRAVVELIDCIEKDRKVTDGIEWPEEIIVLEEGTVYTENQRIRTENVKQIVPIEVATSMYLCLLQDGTVGIVYPEYWNCTEREAVDLWKNVTKICSGYSSYWGLQKTGSILMQRIETWGEEIGLESVEVQVKGNDFVDIDCNDSNTCIAVKADGTTEVITGSDEGNGNLQVDTWSNITQIALGESHTVGLRSDGTVIAVGSNYRGQCDVEKWQNVVYIDACGCCTIGITAEGELLLAGSLY
jgi:hypothetical protein